MGRASNRHDWGQERRRGKRDINQKLEYMIRLLKESRQREQLMAGELNEISAEVKELRTVADSTTALITGLAAKVEAAKNDPAEVQRIVDEMRSIKGDLAAAVTANTPAA